MQRFLKDVTHWASSGLCPAIPKLCCFSVAQSYPTLCDPLDCSPARLLCPWDFLGKNTRVDCHFLLQGIFPGVELVSSALAGGFLYHWATREAQSPSWLSNNLVPSDWSTPVLSHVCHKTPLLLTGGPPPVPSLYPEVCLTDHGPNLIPKYTHLFQFSVNLAFLFIIILVRHYT